MKKYLLIISLLFLVSGSGFSQACCGGMGTAGLRFGLGTANTGSLRLQFLYDLNFMNSVYDKDIRLDDDSRQRVMHSGILEADYGITRRITISGMMTAIVQEIGYTTLDGIRKVEYNGGLGDMLIMAKYRITNPLANNGWGLFAGIGPKLPTGSYTESREDGGNFSMDLQLGTGSVDAVSFLSLSKSHIFVTNLHMNSGVTFALSGKNRNYQDSLTYISGNQFQYTGGFSYNFFHGIGFDVFTNVRYRYQSKDRLSGDPVDNTGGHWLYLSPGGMINFTQNLSLIAFTEIPVYRYLNGPQLTSSAWFSVGVIWNIESRSSKELMPDQ